MSIADDARIYGQRLKRRARRKVDEPTRTREHGTEVTRTTTPDEKIAAIRRIVTEKQYAKIDGIMVDGFSASAIIAVYDALSADARAKFVSFSIPKMASIAFKLVR